MHEQIRNASLYQDRTVQDWHRTAFPSNYHAIDLDLMGCCSVCRKPLYLIEATTNPNKASSILHQLSVMSGVPAFVVWHDQHDVTRAKYLGDGRTFNKERFESVIHKIRRHHDQKEHTR